MAIRTRPGGAQADSVNQRMTQVDQKEPPPVPPIAVLVVPLGLAFVSPLASMIVEAGIVGAFIASTVAGRWEAVAVWRAGRSR